MKLHRGVLKKMAFFLIPGNLIFAANTLAADAVVGEGKIVPIEIPAEKEKTAEQLEDQKRIDEIREEKKGIPEIPKAITREALNPAEKIRLNELELKRAKGQITETEYQLEKDSLARQANIKF